jgi:YVTN family beta-propeller protein
MPLQQNATIRVILILAFLVLAAVPAAYPQSVGATFGEVIYLGGTPSDIVLDEVRQLLYLVNTAAGRVDVYDYANKQLLSPIRVGVQPLAAAMSFDQSTLYVSNNASSSLSVIDLGTRTVKATISLPARPEGVAAGIDGRVLITTGGTGAGSTQNTLLIYDPTQLQQSLQVQVVPFPPPPPTPTGVPGVGTGRPVTTWRGKLLPTPDGQFIVGLSIVGNGNTTYLFVYEVASGTILRSRSVTGQSSVLSMAPDGSKIMAGFTLYDVATLAVLAQMSTSNATFPISGSFNTQQNFGGSTFSPDGGTIYAAFNSAPFSVPATRPQASTLFVCDSSNLSMRLGIKVPESIVARLVSTSDGSDAWALSESGLIHLPLGKLYDYPILMPEQTQVFLAVDECNKGIAKATVKINNLGKGRLTFSVPNTGAALVSQVTSGVTPSSITFMMEPGRAGVNRQPGTNLYTGTATNNGFPVNVNLASAEAINIPPTIRVYMNYRQADQRGIVYPVPMSLDNSQGLQDLQLDEARGKLYVANAGMNRIEVFDLRRQRFVDPIIVGQLPRQMAIASDGVTMYVANGGSEAISIVDLDLGKQVGTVEFPPIPRAGNTGVIFPRTIAPSIAGVQFVMSNGSRWKIVGNTAVPRPVNDGVSPNTFPSGGATVMVATPEGDRIIVLDGTGTGYLYDALADTYTATRRLFNNPIVSYYGPLGASKMGNYFLMNGLILNSSLTVIGGAERPGQIIQTAPTQPGQPPSTQVVSAGQRNVASVAPIDEYTFVRLTTPVRQNINTVTRDDARPTLELVDVRTGAESLAGVAPENPNFTVFGTQRYNIGPRHMVVDSRGTAYVITLSGLSVIPLTVTGSSSARPVIQTGVRGIVNSNDGTTNFRPGSFITVNGSNLASAATAETTPPPTVLGGSCVLFNNIALPLLRTSPGQISAQIPETVLPGVNVVQVKSLATAQSSDPVVVTVQRP